MLLSTSQTAKLLQQERLIAYPTEAVWGLGCNPHSQQAVTELLALKQRSVEQGLILLASTLDQFKPYLHSSLSSKHLAKMAQCERPTTWLVPFNANYVPAWITGSHELLAIRVTQHPIVKALCEQAGFPLVSTSANPHGKPAARTALEVQQYFGDDLPICEGYCGDADRPSTIRILLTGEVLRE